MSCSQARSINTPHFAARTVGLLVVVLAAVLLAAVGWLLIKGRTHLRFSDVQLALDENRWSDAESLSRNWLEHHPQDADAMLKLGESLQRLGSAAEAVEVYRRVPLDAVPQGSEARLAIVSILLRQGRLALAESTLRETRMDSTHAEIADGLWANLLSLSGRQWEAIPYLYRSLNTVGDRRMKLIYLANADEMPAPPEDLFATMLRVRDPLTLLGGGRIAALLGRSEQARQLLKESLAQRPDLIDAQLALGSLLIDSSNIVEFDHWLAKLPRTADAHPTTWFLRGRRAQDLDHRPEAIRCYWEVLRRQPNHDRATYQLGQLLAAEGKIDEAAVFSERARRLTSLIQLSVALYEQRGTEHEIGECVRLSFELGRLRECQAWCDELEAISPNNAVLTEFHEKLNSLVQLDSGLPLLLPGANLAARFDLSSYPLPKSAPLESDSQQTLSRSLTTPCRIEFVDQAQQLGLQFVYFNSDDPSSKGKRMFEYTGGGVAALDYDLDGWSDVYFTQGTSWPPDNLNQSYADSLFRNVGGQQMTDVSSSAAIHDYGFGQGVASSDFDNDGFPDLYVANIDGNRLYKNHGDGTFSDITASSGLASHSYWTTSCLVADLNGDSLPDIYDVTFLEGDDVFSRICKGDDGVPASCAPAGFSAAVDHVYANQGDGTFREVTREWGFDAPNGDGLGIIAADFDESGTISLFIGNDGRANFFFVPETNSAGQTTWNEVGVISGLAYDDSGAAQACMGIGAGDANNDGRLDLFVTNFYNESNTLYINLGARTFTDRARSAGIREPSWAMLGFGAQFLDADRDGWEDLILVNGHVDDFTHKQIPYKMRPQFFQNNRTRFIEHFSKDLGTFFDQPKLGRGLARLDWNRDGLTDVAISHIGDPASLLTNRTQNPGTGLSFKLVGTNRSRDAIGTRITVTSAKNRYTRQLVAGDGYQASNERRIDFGLADETGPVDVEIHWLGGNVQKFSSVVPNHEYLAIEGQKRLLQLKVD